MKKTATSKRLPHRNRDGFTLLETLIGMVIFSVGIMAMANLQIQSVRNNGLARTSSDNTDTALSTVERISSMSWSSNALQPTPGQTETQGSFQVQWSIDTQVQPGVVALTDDLGQPTARLITVTSSYVDKTGAQRSTTLRYIKPRM
jgi:prepilin-type N-terminal cleavage/methylation domain-containing protein